MRHTKYRMFYKAKYNKDIIRNKDKNRINSTIHKPVKYSTEKIMKTGFTLKNNMVFEIEKTLSLCEGF